MKLLSALFAAALLATAAVAPSSVEAGLFRRHHKESSGVSSSSPASSIAALESRLESLVHKIEQIQERREERQVEREEEQEEQEEEEEESEQEVEEEEEESTESESESDSSDDAESDSADYATTSSSPVLSTWSKMTHTWGGPGTKPEQSAWFTVPHLDVKTLSADWVADTAKACNSGTALGNRYKIKAGASNVNTLWYLYGANGEMSGLQSVVTVNPGANNIAPNGPYTPDVGVSGESVWTITAYFRNPQDGSICNPNTPKTGRVGDGLWFPYTGDASKAEAVPLSVTPDQKTIAVATPGQRGYAVGNCMPTMGVHWWRIHWDDKAGSVDPYFLLYHPKTHNLVGFGFLELLGVATQYQVGNYWEHVPVISTPIFMKLNQIPYDVIKGTLDGRKFVIQSQHYYMVDNPQKDISCLNFPGFSTVPPHNAEEVLKQVTEYAASQGANVGPIRALPQSSGRRGVKTHKAAGRGGVIRKPVAKVAHRKH